VAELAIPEGFYLVGKAIKDSGLRDKDIVVLTLKRGVSVISNPRNSRVIEAGDHLLCYGKMQSMRELGIERPRRQRKRKVKKLDPEQIDQLGED
jgi:ribosomal protein S6--L-glutamate ligase